MKTWNRVMTSVPMKINRREDGMMKRLMRFLSFAALLGLVYSCSSKEEGIFTPVNEDNTIVKVSASTEASPTKTTLNDDLSIVWNSTDAISLLATGLNHQFTTSAADLKEGGLKADFNHQGEIDKISYYALYPYSSTASYNGSVISTVLPTVQTAAAGSFGPGANLAIAYAEWGKSFKFKNAAAMVKISFKTTDANAAIKSITFRSLDESILLSGSVSLTPTVENGAVTNVEMAVTNGVPYVTIQAPAGQYLQPETEYYIAAAPAALTSGYRIEFETEDGLTFGKDYKTATYKKAVLKRNLISATGKKNLDNYELKGYFRVRYSESNNHPGTGEYLVVYKMPDGSYRIINEDRTDTYIVKGTHFELSGSGMAFTMSYRKEQMEGMVAYVFRNAWLSSANTSDNITFADDELILSPNPIGIQVNSYKVSSTTYYYANVILYNRTDNTSIVLTLDNLTCGLGSSDDGTIGGKFNTKSATTNPNGNANTCNDLVDALLMHASFSGYDSLVKSAAVSALKGDDNAFTGAFTTATHTTKNGIMCQNHFMIKTKSLLSGAQLSNIWLYKYDTKTYGYYISNK
ncbi:MAG: hypothetical protein E7108_01245 [Bacteroidales bacterium]|nr:hypothetical protein [Bacteroidales bacterium]